MLVVLTRPLAQSRAFAEQLRGRFGAHVTALISPVMEIVPLAFEVDFDGFDGVVFTSQNGVEAYVGANGPVGKRAYCVGGRTAESAREAGLDAVSAEGDIHALNALLQEKAEGKRLLHLSGRKTAGAVRGDVTRVEVYNQKAMPPTVELQSALQNSDPLIVPLFSPNSAKGFQSVVDGGCRAELHAVCLSSAVAEHLVPEHYTSVVVSPEPTADGMLGEITTIMATRGA